MLLRNASPFYEKHGGFAQLSAPVLHTQGAADALDDVAYGLDGVAHLVAGLTSAPSGRSDSHTDSGADDHSDAYAFCKVFGIHYKTTSRALNAQNLYFFPRRGKKALYPRIRDKIGGEKQSASKTRFGRALPSKCENSMCKL